MSVEKSGPKGYEYQYLVSAFIALQLLHKDNVQIFIESENDEDLQVRFDENQKTFIIDIQVKKRDKQVDLIEFSKWITHFENQSNNTNLFSKLHSEENRFVLYVTNSRCKDDVSIFVENNSPINSVLNIGINDDMLEKIKVNSLNCWNHINKLSKERYCFLESFFLQVKKNDFRAILKKNKIWDLQSPDLVRDKLSGILNRNFFVPQSKIEATILELIEIIQFGRDNSCSIKSNIIEILTKYKGTKIFDEKNKPVNRIEKESCERILASNDVLLLSGISLCGKTFLAKEIAQNYQNKGFTIKVTDELHGEEGGLAFLRHVSKEDRLLILEDPFGQIVTNEKSIEIVSNVRKLLANCDSHRKLIITNRKDILLDAMRKNSLSECTINSNNWFDLTVKEFHLEKRIWSNFFGESEDAIDILNRVSDWLLKNEKNEFLQPGQIAYLYNSVNDVYELKKMDETSIVNLARVDSKDLAHKIELRGSDCKDLYIALGICCNTYKHVHLDHLSFVLGDLDEYPSINQESEDDFSIEYSFSKGEEKIEHPEYSRNISIKNEYKNELKYLNRHGYIKFDNLFKTIIFTHPIYHFASKILFQSSIDDFFDKDDTLKIVNKGLSALSKTVNICTLMVLESYYTETKDQIIKNMMLKSLHSIYPSVRDRVIMFFDSRINELDDDEGEKFVNFIKFHKSVKDDVLLWKSGDPYFNNLNRRSFVNSFFQDKKVNPIIQMLQEKIEQKKVLTSEEMWTVLNSNIINNKNDISKNIIHQGLSYDEVFIREKAIFHLFEDYAYRFSNIKKYLDPQEHPNVIYKLFRGALNSWGSYNELFKQEILDFYKNSLSVVSVSIRSLNFLENFEDEHTSDGIKWSKLNHNEVKELWLVWYDIFIALLEKFPSKYIRMDEPHMANVARASLQYVKDKKKIVDFTTSWINWLEQYSEHHLAQDHGMSVAEYLMEGTHDNYELRKDVFNRLVSSNKTSFITTNIKNLIDYWDYLSVDEKQLLLDLLALDREDKSWIRAVALNRKVVPREVQTVLFGEILFEKDIEEIISKLNKHNLLESCINVHCGFPQPLWWNGYHHNNYKLWDEIIINILCGNEYNNTFEVSLKEFIDALYNHNTRRFAEGTKLLEKQLLKTKNKRELIFNRLLTETIMQNQVNKQLWDLLFANSFIDEKEDYINKIVKYIEAVQYYHTNYEDLFCLFDESFIFNEIYPRLEEDYKIYKFCIGNLNYFKVKKEFDTQDIKDEEDIKLIKLFKFYIGHTYDVNPPRLSLTNKFVLQTMKELQIEDKTIKEKIEQNNRNQSHTRKKMAEDFNDDYKLKHWVE